MSEMQRVQGTNNAKHFFAKECLDVSKIETNWDQINHQIVALKKSSSNTEIVKAAEEFSTNYNARHKAKLDYVKQNQTDDPKAREELLKITKDAVVKIQKAIGQQEAIDFIKCIDSSCIQQNWSKVYNSISELQNSENPELKNKAEKFLEKYKNAYKINKNDEANLLSITTEHLDSLKKILNPEYLPRITLPAVTKALPQKVDQPQKSQNTVEDFEKQYFDIQERLKSVRVPQNQQYRIDGLDGLMAHFRDSEKRANIRAVFPEHDDKLLALVPGSLNGINALVGYLEEEKRYAEVQEAIAKKAEERQKTIEKSVKQLEKEPFNFSREEIGDLFFYNDEAKYMPALDFNTGELKYDEKHLLQIKEWLTAIKNPQALSQGEFDSLFEQMSKDPFFTDNKPANSTESSILNELSSMAEEKIIKAGIIDMAVPSTKADGLSFKLSIKDGTTVYQAVVDPKKWAGQHGDIFILASDRAIDPFGFPSEKLRIELNESKDIMRIKVTKRQSDGSFIELEPYEFNRQ